MDKWIVGKGSLNSKLPKTRGDGGEFKQILSGLYIKNTFTKKVEDRRPGLEAQEPISKCSVSERLWLEHLLFVVTRSVVTWMELVSKQNDVSEKDKRGIWI